MSGTIVCWSTGILRCNKENDVLVSMLFCLTTQKEKNIEKEMTMYAMKQKL